MLKIYIFHLLLSIILNFIGVAELSETLNSSRDNNIYINGKRKLQIMRKISHLKTRLHGDKKKIILAKALEFYVIYTVLKIKKILHQHIIWKALCFEQSVVNMLEKSTIHFQKKNQHDVIRKPFIDPTVEKLASVIAKYSSMRQTGNYVLLYNYIYMCTYAKRRHREREREHYPQAKSCNSQRRAKQSE